MIKSNLKAYIQQFEIIKISMSSKVDGSSLELGSIKNKKENEKQSLKPRDVLAGMLLGYIVGILLMMLIHLVITSKCTNCGSSSNALQTDCAEGWILLAGEYTCFFDSYFDVNWTYVDPDAGSNKIDQFFNQIGTLQGVEDDVLIGIVYSNDRGFYQWIGNDPQVPESQSSNSTDVCLNELQDSSSDLGIRLDDTVSGICMA